MWYNVLPYILAFVFAGIAYFFKVKSSASQALLKNEDVKDGLLKQTAIEDVNNASIDELKKQVVEIQDKSKKGMTDEEIANWINDFLNGK